MEINILALTIDACLSFNQSRVITFYFNLFFNYNIEI